jgi:hypothetical protein
MALAKQIKTGNYNLLGQKGSGIAAERCREESEGRREEVRRQKKVSFLNPRSQSKTYGAFPSRRKWAKVLNDLGPLKPQSSPLREWPSVLGRGKT